MGDWTTSKAYRAKAWHRRCRTPVSPPAAGVAHRPSSSRGMRSRRYRTELRGFPPLILDALTGGSSQTVALHSNACANAFERVYRQLDQPRRVSVELGAPSISHAERAPPTECRYGFERPAYGSNLLCRDCCSCGVASQTISTWTDTDRGLKLDPSSRNHRVHTVGHPGRDSSCLSARISESA